METIPKKSSQSDKNIVAAVIQMVSGSDLSENLRCAEELIFEAVNKGATLILLPEVFAVLESGENGLEKMVSCAQDYRGGGDDQITFLQQFLSEQASRHSVTLIGGTIPLNSRPSVDLNEFRGSNKPVVELIKTSSIENAPNLIDRRVRASCLVYSPDGSCIARYDKIHLFDVRVRDRQAEYSESLSYEPGEALVCANTNAGLVGLSVCYDIRFPELYRRLFAMGAKILTIPSAFTKVTGEAHWLALLRARAIENQCFVLAAAQGGVHSDLRETVGRSAIIDPWGEILTCLESGPGCAVATLNFSRLEEVRASMPISNHMVLR